MRLRLTLKISASADYAEAPIGELATLIVDDPSNSLSVPTLAKALGVSTKTLYRWLYDDVEPGRGINEIGKNNLAIKKLVKALGEFKGTSLNDYLKSLGNNNANQSDADGRETSTG